MNLRTAVLTASVLATPLGAQSASEHVALGDREHAALNAPAALRHFEQAIGLEARHAGALWRASREAVDLGEFDPQARDSMYRLGELYARRAVEADPQSSEAHLALARALGRRALALGARERVKFAGQVRESALAAIRLDSANAGALNVMGMWHANVMRLSGVARFLAKNLLGGRVFDEASWSDAVRFLEKAVSLEPRRIVHRLNLAGVYADAGQPAQAREAYRQVLAMAPLEFNDRHYHRQAADALRTLR
jgi:tetratricopeptide (TPR) repeat protein